MASSAPWRATASSLSAATGVDRAIRCSVASVRRNMASNRAANIVACPRVVASAACLVCRCTVLSKYANSANDASTTAMRPINKPTRFFTLSP